MQKTIAIFLSAQLKQTHQIRIFINAFKAPEYFSLERFQISSKGLGPHIILNLKPNDVPPQSFLILRTVESNSNVIV